MNMQTVKTAAGRRLRHPRSGKLLANVDEADRQGHQVNLDDAHWHRAWTRGDIVIIKPQTATAAAATAPMTAAAAPVAATAPAAKPTVKPDEGATA